MNLREKYDQLERRMHDLEARMERLDAKTPAHTGGCTTEDGTIFAPGTGPISERGEHDRWVWIGGDHSDCPAGCTRGFLFPHGPDGGVLPCPGKVAS